MGYYLQIIIFKNPRYPDRMESADGGGGGERLWVGACASVLINLKNSYNDYLLMSTMSRRYVENRNA